MKKVSELKTKMKVTMADFDCTPNFVKCIGIGEYEGCLTLNKKYKTAIKGHSIGGYINVIDDTKKAQLYPTYLFMEYQTNK